MNDLKDGVKSIFYSQAINLGIICLMIIVPFIYLIAGGNEAVEDAGLKIPVMILTILLIIAAIISFVFYIIGLIKVRKENDNFKKAFICLLVNIGANVLAYIIALQIPTAIFNFIGNVATILTMYFFLLGLITLFEKHNNSELVNKGKTLLLLFIIFYAIGTVMIFVSGLLPYTVETASDLLDVIANVLKIVVTVLLVLYLKKALLAFDYIDFSETPQEEVTEEQKEN